MPRGLEFSDEELALLGAALNAEEERRPEASDTVAAIRLLALTGARRREITGLTWGEVRSSRDASPAPLREDRPPGDSAQQRRRVLAFVSPRGSTLYRAPCTRFPCHSP